MAGERVKLVWREYWQEYRVAGRAKKGELLEEISRRTGYHRKYLIRLLNQPLEEVKAPHRRKRKATYTLRALRVVEGIWVAAGYPWSVRLKALLPLWLPWARAHWPGLTPEVEAQVLTISPRQMDRHLAAKRRTAKKRLYGRTKPGTLLRRQIPVKTSHWDVKGPGFTEVDTVSHSGPCASGEWIHSLNMTDIFSGWVETRAMMGASEEGAVEAIEEIRRNLPFELLGIDSDNGSEFINHHLLRYCQGRQIAFTRSRPNKKNDNAHIEQKNWTHVRKVFGWGRFDTHAQRDAMNDLYRHELRVMMNLFQPSVKLIEKRHIGSRITRRYDAPQTPLDRLVAFYGKDALPPNLALLLALRQQLDPFELASRIERALERFHLPQGARTGVASPGRAASREGCPRAALAAQPQETSHAPILR
jgi:hypothetical protein